MRAVVAGLVALAVAGAVTGCGSDPASAPVSAPASGPAPSGPASSAPAPEVTPLPESVLRPLPGLQFAKLPGQPEVLPELAGKGRYFSGYIQRRLTLETTPIGLVTLLRMQPALSSDETQAEAALEQLAKDFASAQELGHDQVAGQDVVTVSGVGGDQHASLVAWRQGPDVVLLYLLVDLKAAEGAARSYLTGVAPTGSLRRP